MCLLSVPIRMHEVARQRTFFRTQPCVQTPVIPQQLIATRTVPINHAAFFSSRLKCPGFHFYFLFCASMSTACRVNVTNLFSYLCSPHKIPSVLEPVPAIINMEFIIFEMIKAVIYVNLLFFCQSLATANTRPDLRWQFSFLRLLWSTFL